MVTGTERRREVVEEKLTDEAEPLIVLSGREQEQLGERPIRYSKQYLTVRKCQTEPETGETAWGVLQPRRG